MNQLLFLRQLKAPNPRMAIVWWTFAVAAGSIQLVNALGLLGPPSFGLMFLGLVVVLSQAGAQFVHMVFAVLGRSTAQLGPASCRGTARATRSVVAFWHQPWVPQ